MLPAVRRQCGPATQHSHSLPRASSRTPVLRRQLPGHDLRLVDEAHAGGEPVAERARHAQPRRPLALRPHAQRPHRLLPVHVGPHHALRAQPGSGGTWQLRWLCPAAAAGSCCCNGSKSSSAPAPGSRAAGTAGPPTPRLMILRCSSGSSGEWSLLMATQLVVPSASTRPSRHLWRRARGTGKDSNHWEARAATVSQGGADLPARVMDARRLGNGIGRSATSTTSARPARPTSSRPGCRRSAACWPAAPPQRCSHSARS